MKRRNEIHEAIERADRAFNRARDEANRLAVLSDFLSNWSDHLTKEINDRIHEKYGESHNVDRIYFTSTGKRINEVLMITFDFDSGEITDYDSDEFTRDVIQPAIDEITPHPHLEIAPNTDRMALGAYAINVNPTNITNYSY